METENLITRFKCSNHEEIIAHQENKKMAENWRSLNKIGYIKILLSWLRY